MFSLNFSPQGEAAKKCLTRGGLLVLFLAMGNAGAQEFDFNRENFLVPPVPIVATCSDCVGELFLRMSEPEIADGRASIGVLLRASLSSSFTATPYLGNYVFHVAVGGVGIELVRTSCNFTVASGVQSTYNPVPLAVGSASPLSLTVNQVAPGFGLSSPSTDTHYRLSTDGFSQFGTFSCPISDTSGVNAYILAPVNVYGFTVQVGVGNQQKLLLRADNSYRYYPLDGDAPFVAATGDPVDSSTVTVSLTSNLVGVPSTARNFTFSPGCGVAPDSSVAPVVPEVPITTTVTDIKISFGESQIYNDCVVTYDVVVPGNSYSLTQRLGETPIPPGGDVVSTVVVSLNVGSSSPIQVIDLEDPNLVYSAYANVRTTSGDPLPVSAAYSLDGEEIDNADIGDEVTVQFSDRNKEINLNIAFNAAREAAIRSMSGANPVQILTLEVRVGDSEPWSKSYLVVSKTEVAAAMNLYRNFLGTVITSTEGIVGEEVDAGFFLAQLLSTGAAVIVDKDVIQNVLNAAVGGLINLPDSGFSSSIQNEVLTDAYSFSGSLDNLGVTEASFVIDLGSSQLTSPARLAKQIRTGVEQWRGVDNGSGGSVSYSTNRYLLPPSPCLPANAESGWLDTDNGYGLLPASSTTPIRCIRITIADNGVYDVDGADPELFGFISDSIVGVADSPDIVLAHAPQGCSYEPGYFLAGPGDPMPNRSTCVGSVTAQMRNFRATESTGDSNGRAVVDIWLETDLPSTHSRFLGGFEFDIAVDGAKYGGRDGGAPTDSGIDLRDNVCAFSYAEGVLGGSINIDTRTFEPVLSLAVSAGAPEGGNQVGLMTNYVLKRDFEHFGTFTCPILDRSLDRGYVFGANKVFEFRVHDEKTNSSGDFDPLVLRADNSYRYYPLDGDAPFVAATGDPVDSSTVTVSLTSNLVGVPSTARNFTFSSGINGCGVAPVVPEVPITTTVTDIKISFGESQIDNDCVVTYDVVVPGNSYSLTQRLGETPIPPGGDVVSTVVVSLNVGSDPIQVIDLEDPNLVYSAYANVRTTSGDPLSVSAAYSLDGEKIDNADIGDETVQFSDRNKEINLNLAFNAAREAAIRSMSGANPVQILTLEVRVGDSEPWSKSYLVVSKTEVAAAMNLYRNFLGTVITSTEGIVGEEVDAGFFLAQLLSTGAAVIVDKDVIQNVLNAAVGGLINLPDSGFSSSIQNEVLTDAYSFSGSLDNLGVTEASFVIDLGSSQLTSPARLAKQIRTGVEQWRGVDNGSGGSVSYSTNRYLLPPSPCLPANAESGWLDTDNGYGLLPASSTTPIRCIRITIADNGVYDVDGADPELFGFISDSIVGVADSPDIVLAHAPQGCSYEPGYFLAGPGDPMPNRSTCVGSVTAQMRNFRATDQSTEDSMGRAVVDIWLKTDLPSTHSRFLGDFEFDIAVDGAKYGGGDGGAPTDSGIDLRDNNVCAFSYAEGVLGGSIDIATRTFDPVLSLAVSARAPGDGNRVGPMTNYVLKRDFERFGTFTCPILDRSLDRGYVFGANKVFEFRVHDEKTNSVGDFDPLVLRADNSYRYYPLDGDAPFVAATGDPVDSSTVTVSLTSNLVGVPSTARNFTFSPGCGVAPDSSVAPVVPDVPITLLDTEIPIVFAKSQIDNDCVVTYDVVVPGNSYSLTQRLGETPIPPGGDVVSTVVVSLNVGSDPIQVVDLEDPNLVYSAYANVRTTSGDPLPVSAAYSLDGEEIDNADIGDEVTVQFSDRNKEINLNIAFNAAREAAIRSMSGANPVQILTLEVRVGDSEPWSKSYLVVSKTEVAAAMNLYRNFLGTVITSTEGIVGEEVDAGFFLAQLLSTGAAVIVDKDVIQNVLNAAVGGLINLPDSGFSSSIQNEVLTDAYSFSGSLDNLGVTEASFVIDLGSSQLTSPARLAKQIRTGVEQWRGVDNGSGGSVSYSTNRYLLPPSPCLPANAESGWLDTDNGYGLLPASSTTPIRCIRITIADNGVYDVDGADPELFGFISDSIVGVADSPDIVLAHAPQGCSYEPGYFLAGPGDPMPNRSTCVGSVTAQMRNFRATDQSTEDSMGRAVVDIWLKTDLPSTHSRFLGDFEFDIAVDGAKYGGGDGGAPTDSGIDLRDNNVCAFSYAEGVLGGSIDIATRTFDPVLSLAVSARAPGDGNRVGPMTNYVLKRDFERFGTFTCPILDRSLDRGYVFGANKVFEFRVHDEKTNSVGDFDPLVLRADNSYRYYPLDGDAPFVAATGDPVDSSTVTVSLTSNLVGVPSTARNFTFSPGCGVAPDSSVAPVVPDVPITTTVTDIKISFGESQIDNDCVVTYDVVVPGNSYSLTQRLGETPIPPGGDVVSTVVVSLNVGSSSPIQVIDLEDPNLVYSAYANVRTTSSERLSIFAAYSLDGEKIGGASLGDEVTVQFSDQNKKIDLTEVFIAAREAAIRSMSGANPVQILTLEVRVGDSELWSKSYLVVSKTAVAYGMAAYRDLLNTVITSTEGIVGEEVDAGFFLAELLSRSTGAAVIVGQEVIQGELNDAVGRLINLPESGFSSTQNKVLITDAYTFSGSLDNLGVTEASFVIDLGDRQLTSPTRLAKQIRTGGEYEQWRGVDNGSGGSVSYSTVVNLLGAGAQPPCPEAADAVGWMNTDNGVLPAASPLADQIRCIRITIADDGVYDVDGADLGQPGLSGFISDPIAGVEDSPDIVLAHAGGGGGSDGWIVALAVLGGLLFAGSAGLWMIFALLAILALSLWRRRSEVVAHHRSEF